MRRTGLGLSLVLSTSFFMNADSIVPLARAAPYRSTGGVLPLRTVRLYETGVAYFERTGAVSSSPGGGRMTLPVPAGHLDDALKTLVVLGGPGAGARPLVHGLEFGSSMSKGMARALAGLPAAADEPISTRDLLASLKGAPVYVQVQGQGAGYTGRIVEVLDAEGEPPVSSETRQQALNMNRPAGEPGAGQAQAQGQDKGKDGARPRQRPDLVVVLLSDRSELRRFRASEIAALRPLDGGSASRLASALDALSVRGAQTRRDLRLLTTASGPVTIGYIAEAPVWRTTYRLVLAQQEGTAAAAGSQKGGTLQGWALIHNDADEDWRGVRVQLVNGKPDSFLYPLAAPRYERRELQHPENELSTVPQLLDTTVDAIWGDNTGGLSASSAGVGGSGYGSIGLGRIGTVGHGAGGGGTASGSGVSGSSVLQVGDLASIAPAAGVEAGALFTYTLAAPLDLRAHGSALVPFVQEAVEVEALTLFAGPGNGQAGRSGARLVNSTRQTLPQGPIALFAEGGFAGEALLDRLKPGERRFLQFGTDLDVDLSVARSKSREEVKRLTFAGGRVVEHFLRHTDTAYEIENRSAQGRRVYVALGIGQNAKVSGADRVDYDAVAGKPMAVLQAPGRRRTERALAIVEGLSRTTPVERLSAAWLAERAAMGGLPAAERAAAGEAAARAREMEAAQRERDRLKGEVGKIEEDLKRWREDLKALGGAGSGPGAGHGQGAAAPFVKRILEAEDRLAGLRDKATAQDEVIKGRRDAMVAVLDRLR